MLCWFHQISRWSVRHGYVHKAISICKFYSWFLAIDYNKGPGQSTPILLHAKLVLIETRVMQALVDSRRVDPRIVCKCCISRWYPSLSVVLWWSSLLNEFESTFCELRYAWLPAVKQVTLEVDTCSVQILEIWCSYGIASGDSWTSPWQKMMPSFSLNKFKDSLICWKFGSCENGNCISLIHLSSACRTSSGFIGPAVISTFLTRFFQVTYKRTSGRTM